MSLPSFESFYEAVHGQQPFPWQGAAAKKLAARETFTVAVPTGLGKSALVDAAIWAAAHGAWRRIAFVVDRRIVVDAVHQRAKRIESRLDEGGAELAPIARQLGQVQVVRLRGGVFGDDDWVLYPERVTVALTTVDQLGSRLMFRGYGVSSRRWPMHAGFFADDTLVIVDEAHLSEPFLQTLQALRRYGANVSLVPMSATLRSASGGQRLALGPDDLALPIVQQRLGAQKMALLVTLGASEKEFVDTATVHAEQLTKQAGCHRIALVVNRVATARRCFNRLVAQGVNAVLLTGRVRPAERDAQLAGLLPRVEAGRDRADAGDALVVVATQTIEVGADFDFDALVTEAAPVSSLRQRFGRVDRLGGLGSSASVILLRQAGDREDPIYGQALRDATTWLLQRGEMLGGRIDFGLEAFDTLLAMHAAPSESAAHAATLLPTHVEMLAQTGPYAPEIDLSSWLHGVSDRAPDVTVVWRDDMAAHDPLGWSRAVQLLPPMLREGLSLPVAALRRWLCGQKHNDEWGDAGGTALDPPKATDTGRVALRWRGQDECEVVDPSQIRPGDTIVLPAVYGGCDVWGWAPDSDAPVSDLADGCLAERLEAGATRRPVLRLTDGHWPAYGVAADGLHAVTRTLKDLQAQAPASSDDMEDEVAAARAGLLEAVAACGHPLVAGLFDPRIDWHPLGVVVRGGGIEEVGGVIETGKPVPLDVHHADVGRWVDQLCSGSAHQAVIIAAAIVHDAGKAEPRMQALLHGSRVAAAGGPLLAKSALRRREQQISAWAEAAVPRGFRHEFASLDYTSLTDPLTRHLVATHHGYGRPWLMPCADAQAPGASFAALGTGWLAQWSAVQAQHGPWALAAMEWRLRAADARASIEEANA